jgi:hypothetical protein
MTDFELRVIEAALEDAYFTKLVPTENLLKFARAVREIVGEECAKVFRNQKYMVLQPTRTYTAQEVCDAQRSAVESIKRQLLRALTKGEE